MQSHSRPRIAQNIRLAGGQLPYQSCEGYLEALTIRLQVLLAYAEYLGPAPRADTLSRRTLVLHSDGPWVLDLNLLSAFHAICLHLYLLAPRICF